MIEAIKKLVESETRLENIETRTRNQEYVDARVLYTILALTHTKYSYARIGKLINRDHSSVNHHQKIYKQWLKQPDRFSYNLEAYNKLTKVIETGREEIDQDTDLLIMYREKNRQLEYQVKQQQRTIERLKERIEQLKKYEPVW